MSSTTNATLPSNSNEEWETIPDFPNYDISSFGRVRIVNSGRKRSEGSIKAPYTDKDGFVHISLIKDGKTNTFLISSLVAVQFMKNDSTTDVCTISHKDGDKSNNRVDNLEFHSVKQDVLDKLETQIFKPKKTQYRINQPNLKLNQEKADEIRKEYHSTKTTQKALSIKYGVSPATICLVLAGKYW